MTGKGKPVQAHISGVVFRIDAGVGVHVKELDPVITLESMKMEMPVESPAAGKVTEMRVETGQFVNEGDVVAIIE
ncbi:MAG TPA: acetyl-CoA carboxylase biotin carboxyl carrier protein subunit [Planctomycetota bacterium]|nr:acetyl-CoA carboxylase biotin carboxyl carrier protein subunit [Planctomycetota bacterium]